MSHSESISQTVVMSCIIRCGDECSRIWMRTKRNFHPTWITRKDSLIKWTPEAHFSEAFISATDAQWEMDLCWHLLSSLISYRMELLSWCLIFTLSHCNLLRNRVHVGFRLWVTDLQVSSRNLTTWQCTWATAPEMVGGGGGRLAPLMPSLIQLFYIKLLHF